MGLVDGDADPNPAMNVWLSSGATHVWNMHEKQPATAWEAEIDRLMNQQMITIDAKRRKRLYDQVQQLIAENLPFIFLATSDVLVGAKNEIGNFHPATLDPYVLWNVEELYIRRPEIANAH
jgi:peptide/nickel transport system substrate-binding protein